MYGAETKVEGQQPTYWKEVFAEIPGVNSSETIHHIEASKWTAPPDQATSMYVHIYSV